MVAPQTAPATFERLKDHYQFEFREEIAIKSLGVMKTYLLPHPAPPAQPPLAPGGRVQLSTLTDRLAGRVALIYLGRLHNLAISYIQHRGSFM